MNVFILCAGDGVRWGNHLGIPKHFIEFGGESLVKRTLRLLQSYQPYRIFYVARSADLAPDDAIPVFLEQTSCLADTIQQTSLHWNKHNIFLLGDVFYSPDAICCIMKHSEILSFFGRPWGSQLVRCGHGELFGLVLREQAVPKVESLLKAAIVACVEGHVGNLWNIYQLAVGEQLGNRQISSSWIEVIDDYTNDIDTPVDYLRRRDLYERIAKEF